MSTAPVNRVAPVRSRATLGNRFVRRAGRRVVRTAGIATSPLRPGPDFIIIGAKRAGTTSLYRYLVRHPRVLPMFPSNGFLPLKENLKGVHYFDTGYGHGNAWYHSHFPSQLTRIWASRRSGGRVITGEASPYYFFHPHAAERAARAVGSARLVLLLRDPVERTFSHYREQVRNGVEHLDFEAALAAEPRRLADAREAGPKWADSFAYEHQSYVAQSEYATAIVRWLAVYPRSQLLIVRSEDFYADPQGVYDEVLIFLKLPPYPLTDVASWNAAPTSAMRPSTRQKLCDHFASHNAELAALLGRDFGWCT